MPDAREKEEEYSFIQHFSSSTIFAHVCTDPGDLPSVSTFSFRKMRALRDGRPPMEALPAAPSSSVGSGKNFKKAET